MIHLEVDQASWVVQTTRNGQWIYKKYPLVGVCLAGDPLMIQSARIERTIEGERRRIGASDGFIVANIIANKY